MLTNPLVIYTLSFSCWNAFQFFTPCLFLPQPTAIACLKNKNNNKNDNILTKFYNSPASTILAQSKVWRKSHCFKFFGYLPSSLLKSIISYLLQDFFFFSDKSSWYFFQSIQKWLKSEPRLVNKRCDLVRKYWLELENNQLKQ